MNWQAVLIDVILLLIVGVFVLISAKRGFVRVAVEVLGFVAAVILTLTVCTPLANATYDKIIEPPILKSVDDEVSDTVDQTVDSIINELPDFLQSYLNSSGIADKIISENGGLIQGGTHDLVADISQNSIKPVTVKILSTVYAVIMLTVLMIAVKILAVSLNKCFSFSLVGKLNRTLGGICGLIKGIAVLLIICFAINLLLPITEGGIWIFNTENIEKTYIFRFLISLGEF